MSSNKTISDYKYRQLRAMISRAKVRKGVKDLLHCTLRDYKKEQSVPAADTFEKDGKRRCLIGAAVHNVDIYNELQKTSWGAIESSEWENAAAKYFGVDEETCHSIINGFDNRVTNENGDETSASQYLASEFGKGNRVAFLAHRLRRALLG